MASASGIWGSDVVKVERWRDDVCVCVCECVRVFWTRLMLVLGVNTYVQAEQRRV